MVNIAIPQKAQTLHQTVERLLSLENEPQFSAARAKADTALASHFDQIFEVIRAVQQHVLHTPPGLMSESGIKALNETLNSVRIALKQYTNTPSAESISNAISRALLAFSQVPLAFLQRSPLPSTKAADEIVDHLRSRTNAAMEDFEKRKRLMDGNTSELEKEIAEIKKKTDALALEVEKHRKEAVGVVADVQTEYSKVERELRESFDGKLHEMIEEYAKFRDASNDRVAVHLKVLEEQETNAKKVAQAVGEWGIIANYGAIADAEAKIANELRTQTIQFFSLGVLVALAAFILPFFLPHEKGDFWSFAIRFVTAIAIASPAFYTARESARHRTTADRAKQREIELTSLGSYIALLSDEVQTKIRTELIPRYFGGEVERHDVHGPELKDLNELLKTALDGVVKVKKA